MRLYRAVSLAEFEDLRRTNYFRQGPNSLEGKWFADTHEGVLLRVVAHYPDGDGRIVAADVPDRLIGEAFRMADLDGFGPATYLEATQLIGIVPIVEFSDG